MKVETLILYSFTRYQFLQLDPVIGDLQFVHHLSLHQCILSTANIATMRGLVSLRVSRDSFVGAPGFLFGLEQVSSTLETLIIVQFPMRFSDGIPVRLENLQNLMITLDPYDEVAPMILEQIQVPRLRQLTIVIDWDRADSNLNLGLANSLSDLVRLFQHQLTRNDEPYSRFRRLKIWSKSTLEALPSLQSSLERWEMAISISSVSVG